MKRVLVMFALTALVLGVAGTALAEHSTIDPFGSTTRAAAQSRTTVTIMEHGTIDPWGSTIQ